MRVLVTFDAKAFDRQVAGLDEAARGELRTQIAGEINRVGRQIHAALIEPLKIQTGLKGDTISRAVGDVPGDAASLSYALVTRGGDIALKYFGPKEENGGVTAYPKGRATHIAGAFLTSGPAGNRKAPPKLGGHVYRNIANGAWGGKIEKAKSGVYIPKEMVRGAALAAFERAAAAGLPPIAAKVMTIIAGRA